jgi:hypothetical protein
MDQERFDQISRRLGAWQTRRRALGGMLAGVLAASSLMSSTVEARRKNRKRNKRNRKRGRKRSIALSAEQILGQCSGLTDPTCPGCCHNTGGSSGILCVANGTNGLCGVGGASCVPAGVGHCCSATGQSVVTPPGNCGASTGSGTGGVCTPCFHGCCEAHTGRCLPNGSGVCGVGGVQCAVPTDTQCCTANGVREEGLHSSTTCGVNGALCQTCTGNATCELGTCTGGPSPTPVNCPPGMVNCGGVCADLGSNPNNCGSCGTRCSCRRKRRPVCQGGACKCLPRKKRRKRR